MSDLKSKIPDLNEITSMAGKLFKDVKQSITEIIADYKESHPQQEESAEVVEKHAEKPAEDAKKPAAKADNKGAPKESAKKKESVNKPVGEVNAAKPEEDDSAKLDK